MFEINEDFKKIALSHYGYDGGNLDSNFWISGLEWGGGISISELEKDILNGVMHTPNSIENLAEREKYLKYKFDVIWMKILSKAKGLQVDDYRKMVNEDYRVLSSQGPVMKLNLYPISFKNTSSDFWNKEFYKITGFPTKELYIAWIQGQRFKMFNDLIIKHGPRVVLCSGITYKNDFLLAYGGLESLFARPKEEIIISSNKKILIYDSCLSENTKLYIVPFLGSVNGIKSNLECEELGELIGRDLE